MVHGCWLWQIALVHLLILAGAVRVSAQNLFPLPPLDDGPVSAGTPVVDPAPAATANGGAVGSGVEVEDSKATGGDVADQGNRIAGDATVVEDASTAEPAWYEFGYWIRPTPWDGSVELGVTGTEGNSQTFSLALGAHVKRKTDTNSLAVDAAYVKSSARSVETANNAFLKGRDEWLLPDSPWTLYIKGTLEYDEFRAFDLRLAGNGGVGYRLLKTDRGTLTGRFGGGVSHEIGGPDDRYVPEAMYGLDLEYQLTAKQKILGEANYYPSWENYNDYRAETSVSWEILLDEATNLSLKLSATDRYDSTPSGRDPNDLDYGVLLMWKL